MKYNSATLWHCMAELIDNSCSCNYISCILITQLIMLDITVLHYYYLSLFFAIIITSSRSVKYRFVCLFVLSTHIFHKIVKIVEDAYDLMIMHFTCFLLFCNNKPIEPTDYTGCQKYGWTCSTSLHYAIAIII